jgi:hypothetical protein
VERGKDATMHKINPSAKMYPAPNSAEVMIP